MILKPQSNFKSNGTLKGTIVAYDDGGNPLGWELDGNWSSLVFRTNAARSMAEITGVSVEKAMALLTQVLIVARKEAPEYHSEKGVPEKSEKRAVLPKLVDIVATNDGSPVFMFLNNGVLETLPECKYNGILYVPPNVEHMPYLLPREAEVRRAYTQDDNKALFDSLVEWHKTASKLGEEYHYHFIALYDFHTYLADRVDYSPYLVFQTLDAERGKSRQGNSIAWVAYRGLVTETLQEANLFRWSDSLMCTLFFDVRDIITKTERRMSDDILLGRFQRYGAKVARVLDPQAGPFDGVKYFNVYGPTIMALNQPLKEPYLSRSIVIVPPEATGKYPNLNPKLALPLKERLVAFRARHLEKPLSDVAKPVDGRLGDILQPFCQIAILIGYDTAAEFPRIARALARERSAERAETREARLITVVEEVFGDNGDEKLSISKITETYNEGLGEKSKISEESVGKRLKGLGFKEARLSGGGRARLYDSELLSALKRKYGLDLRDVNEPSQLSHLPLPDSGQSSDSSMTDEITVMTDANDGDTTVTKNNNLIQPQNKDSVTVVTGVTDKIQQGKATSRSPLDEKPSQVCYACKSYTWWQRRDGGWVCGTCHPNPQATARGKK